VTITQGGLTSEQPDARGRNRIAARALNRVVAAVTADALGVRAARVGVELGDRDGFLSVTVTTPIRVPSLRSPQPAPDSIVQRAADARSTIRDRVAELTGHRIAHVTVRLSAADIQEQDRVR